MALITSYFTPKHDDFELAICQKDLDMVKEMCKYHPARVNAKALVFAAWNGNVEVMKYLWGLVGSTVTQEDLKQASSTPHAANLKFLFEHGLSVSDLDHDRILSYVLFLDKRDMFEVLASYDRSFVEIAREKYPRQIKDNIKEFLDSSAYLRL